MTGNRKLPAFLLTAMALSGCATTPVIQHRPPVVQHRPIQHVTKPALHAPTNLPKAPQRTAGNSPSDAALTVKANEKLVVDYGYTILQFSSIAQRKHFWSPEPNGSVRNYVVSSPRGFRVDPLGGHALAIARRRRDGAGPTDAALAVQLRGVQKILTFELLGVRGHENHRYFVRTPASSAENHSQQGPCHE
jgi:hypothetical protein